MIIETLTCPQCSKAFNWPKARLIIKHPCGWLHDIKAELKKLSPTKITRVQLKRESRKLIKGKLIAICEGCGIRTVFKTKEEITTTCARCSS